MLQKAQSLLKQFFYWELLLNYYLQFTSCFLIERIYINNLCKYKLNEFAENWEGFFLPSLFHLFPVYMNEDTKCLSNLNAVHKYGTKRAEAGNTQCTGICRLRMSTCQISSFLSKQNIVLYATNGQLKTGKTGTQQYAEHSRASIPWLKYHRHISFSEHDFLSMANFFLCTLGMNDLNYNKILKVFKL